MSERRRLPVERKAVTHRFVIRAQDGAHKGYVTAGLFVDGSVGEIFVKLDKQGSEISGLLDCWAIAVSWLLQSGISLQQICDKYRGHRFHPGGITENPNVRFAASPVDYIVRWLEGSFVDNQLHNDNIDDTASGTASTL
jgi:ribonucleoside-diphosphate reductase alpha chain